MKTNQIISIYIFAIALIHTSCCDTNTYGIPDDERIAVNVLDTAIFVSDTHRIDTLYIGDVGQDIYPNSDYGPDGCYRYQLQIGIKYVEVKSKKERPIFSLWQAGGKKNTTTGVNIFKESTLVKLSYLTTHKSIELGGKTYKDVWEFESEAENQHIYVNQEFGLLSYKSTSSGILYLSKYIKAQ